MAAIFSFIGFLGVLAGAAATGAGLYETFGETQKAVDAWVSGAQVFFSGAMLMALGSVAARVRGTTRAVDDLAKAVKALRGELVSTARPAVTTEPEPAARVARPASENDMPREQAVRGRDADRDPREPVLERRPATPAASGQVAGGSGGQRRTRLGPALDDTRDGGGEPSRRGGRLRRPFDDE